MAYTLVKNITTVNRTVGGNAKKYIVIHYTGNVTDTAKANSNYFKSVNRGASAHYFVDKTTVYQVVEDNDKAWSVGVNYGTNNLFSTVKNSNSINIEMCSDNGAIAEETFNNTVELTKSLMKKYNIPASNVYRHWDICSKSCPGWNGWGANGKDASIWNRFKQCISGNPSTVTSTPSSSSTTSTTSTSTRNYLQKGDKGTAVKEMQTMLIACGYSCGTTGADGDFGANTLTALKAFQKANGLTVDGLYGTNSKTKLTSVYNAKKTASSKTSTTTAKSTYSRVDFIKEVQKAIGAKVDGIAGSETLSKTVTVSKSKNSRHAVVKPIQKYLNAIGYNCGTVDGIAGTKFDSAVKAFQKANGCVVDGEVTAKNKTWRALLGMK